MGSPGVGGNLSSASDIAFPTTRQIGEVLYYKAVSGQNYWSNVLLTDVAASTTNGGAEKVNTLTGAGAAPTINLALGNVVNWTLGTQNVTGFTISGVPASGKACAFTLYVNQPASGTARTINWSFTGGTLKWAGGVVPTVTAALGATDVFVFETFDGGTNWFGSLVGSAFAVGA